MSSVYIFLLALFGHKEIGKTAEHLEKGNKQENNGIGELALGQKQEERGSGLAKGEDHHTNGCKGADLGIGNKLGHRNGNGIIHHNHKEADEEIETEENDGRGGETREGQKRGHTKGGQKQNVAYLSFAREAEKEKIAAEGGKL